MSNTIQIKRGKRKPDYLLAPYELGIDINDGQLYYGGPISNNKYGKAQGIKAEGAIKIVDDNGNGCSVGSSAGPIYLSNGKFLPCGDDATIPGTIDYAKALNPGATIVTNLQEDKPAIFTGAENSQTIIGATGVLPISKGGTGATTAQNARQSLGITPENIGALSVNGGTLTCSDPSKITWLLTLLQSENRQQAGWGAGLKFKNTNEDGKFAGIACGCPNTSQYYNQNELYFFINGGSDSNWIFKMSSNGFYTNKIVLTTNSGGYGTDAPTGTPPNGTVYFQVV